jgi:hypothetical protein
LSFKFTLSCQQSDIVPIICHHLPQVSTTPSELVGKFASGVVDNIGEFATGVGDTGGAP